MVPVRPRVLRRFLALVAVGAFGAAVFICVGIGAAFPAVNG